MSNKTNENMKEEKVTIRVEVPQEVMQDVVYGLLFLMDSATANVDDIDELVLIKKVRK